MAAATEKKKRKFTYGDDLRGNVPAVIANNAQLQRGAIAFLNVVNEKQQYDDLQTRNFAKLARQTFADFHTQRTTYNALQQLRGLFTNISEQMARHSKCCLSAIGQPLKDLRNEIAASNKKLNDEQKKLEKERETLCAAAVKAKQKYFKAAKETEDLQTQFEKAWQEGERGTKNAANIQKLNQKTQAAKKDCEHCECLYQDAATKVQEFAPKYTEIQRDILQGFQHNDNKVLDATRKGIVNLVVLYDSLAKILQQETITLREVADLIACDKDTEEFVQQQAKPVDDWSANYKFHSYDWKTEPLSAQAITGEGGAATSTQAQKPQHTTVQKSCKQIDIALLDRLDDQLIKMMENTVTPQGIQQLRKGCSHVRQFVHKSGPVAKVKLSFVVKAACIKGETQGTENVVLGIRTNDYKDSPSDGHRVIVTEDNLMDAFGNEVTCMEDLEKNREAAHTAAGVQIEHIPDELFNQWYHFVTNLAVFDAPPSPTRLASSGKSFSTPSSQSLDNSSMSQDPTSPNSAASKSSESESKPKPSHQEEDVSADSHPLAGGATEEVPPEPVDKSKPPPLPPLSIGTAKEGLKTHDGRIAFGRALTKMRVLGVCLTRDSYESLKDIMAYSLKVVLDEADFKSGAILLNMCQTYCYNTGTAAGNYFLQQDFKGNPLFMSMLFWEESFYDAYATEKAKQASTQGRWQDMGQEEQMDVETREQNIAFGQLTSFVFNMISSGVKVEQVQAFGEKICAINQLSDDYQLMLMATVQSTAEQHAAKEEQFRKLRAGNTTESPKQETKEDTSATKEEAAAADTPTSPATTDEGQSTQSGVEPTTETQQEQPEEEGNPDTAKDTTTTEDTTTTTTPSETTEKEPEQESDKQGASEDPASAPSGEPKAEEGNNEAEA